MKKILGFTLCFLVLLTLTVSAAVSPSAGAVTVVSASGKPVNVSVAPISVVPENVQVPVWATATPAEIAAYVEAVVNANPGLQALFGASITAGASGTDAKVDVTLIKNITDAVLQKKIEDTCNPVNLISAVEVSGSDYSPEDFPLTLTFTVDLPDGETAGILHGLADGTFEYLEGVVSNGQVSVTVNSLSPFFIFRSVPAKAITDQIPLSPQTSDSIGAGITFISLAAGISAVAVKSRKKTR